MPHYSANRNWAVTPKLACVLERYHEQGPGITLLPPVVQGLHFMLLLAECLGRGLPLASIFQMVYAFIPLSALHKQHHKSDTTIDSKIDSVGELLSFSSSYCAYLI